MAKVRVYELAKDVGMESKDVLAKLQEMGEFVRSASSTVEPPVVRKFLDKFPPVNKPAVEKPAKKAAPKKAAAKKSDAEIPAIEKNIPEVPPSVTPKASNIPQPPRPPAARPGNNPFGTSGPRPPRPPAARPGNNPFGTSAARPPRPAPRGDR